MGKFAARIEQQLEQWFMYSGVGDSTIIYVQLYNNILMGIFIRGSSI